MSEKSATSPKETVRTLPSLRQLSDNTMEWSNEQLNEYDDILNDYRMCVYRILKLRQAIEEEEKQRED